MSDGILEIAPEGKVEVADFFALFERFEKAPNRDGPLSVLIDTREGGVVPRPREVLAVDEYFASHQDVFRPRRALVVSSPIMRGIGNMAAALRRDHGSTTRVFTDIAQARIWLRELPEAKPE